MDIGHRSDVGHVRRRNEDGWLIREVGGAVLAAVADGMGGHPAGDVASAIAIATIEGQLAHDHAARDPSAGRLVDALVLADGAIQAAAAERPDRYRMGTTAIVAYAVPGEVTLAHVGDSRAYLVRGGAALPLTHDHGEGGFLTQALGLGDVRPDVCLVEVGGRDRLVLCTDGLSGMLDDATIATVATSAGTAQAAADELVACALDAGGYDNVTVVVLGELGRRGPS